MDKKLILNELINNNGKTNNFVVFSGNHYTFESALNEIMLLQKGAKLIKWFSEITALIYLPNGMDALNKSIIEHPPIFLQHIFPVQHTVNINKYNDINEFAKIASDIFIAGINTQPFSVQVSVYDIDCQYSTYNISKSISNILEDCGKNLDVKNPTHVISIAIDCSIAYMGISKVKQNLSKWSSGIIHYSKEFNRAQYKFDECIEYFNLKINGGIALDIGAAPGGWTKALSKQSFKVWAVDPAALDDTIKNIKGVTHIKKTAQQFLKDNKMVFDIITNDMIMDCRESASIMNQAVNFLSPNGYGIMTAKLPKKGYNKRLKTAIKILSQKYIIHGVNQLPSNKSEVTILLSRL